MKNIREFTDEQVVEIGKLAMSEFLNQELFMGLFNGKQLDWNFRITREIFDWTKDRSQEFMVIRTYLDGYGDKTYFHIWEGEEGNEIEVDVVVDSQDYHCANIVKIVKKLIEWEFVSP